MLRDWRERQICDNQELPALLTEAAQAGFEAVRLERWRNGYRVTFQAMQSAADYRGARAVDMQAENGPENVYLPSQKRITVQGEQTLARPSVIQLLKLLS